MITLSQTFYKYKVNCFKCNMMLSRNKRKKAGEMALCLRAPSALLEDLDSILGSSQMPIIHTCNVQIYTQARHQYT